MTLVPGKVLLVYQEIVVRIQFPKSAIQDIKMLIRKVLTDDIDVIFIAHLKEGLHQIGQFEISPRNLVIIVGVNYKKNTHDYGVCVAILEFRRRL